MNLLRLSIEHFLENIGAVGQDHFVDFELLLQIDFLDRESYIGELWIPEFDGIQLDFASDARATLLLVEGIHFLTENWAYRLGENRLQGRFCRCLSYFIVKWILESETIENEMD